MKPESLAVSFTAPGAPSRVIISSRWDPGGRQWNAIHPSRVVGASVVEAACEVIAPGIAVHHDLNRGSSSANPTAVDRSRGAGAVQWWRAQAGFDAPVRDNIQLEHLAETLGANVRLN